MTNRLQTEGDEHPPCPHQWGCPGSPLCASSPGSLGKPSAGVGPAQVVAITSSFHCNSERLPLAKRFLPQPVINGTLKRGRASLSLSDKRFCCPPLLTPDGALGSPTGNWCSQNPQGSTDTVRGASGTGSPAPNGAKPPGTPHQQPPALVVASWSGHKEQDRAKPSPYSICPVARRLREQLSDPGITE